MCSLLFLFIHCYGKIRYWRTSKSSLIHVRKQNEWPGPHRTSIIYELFCICTNNIIQLPFSYTGKTCDTKVIYIEAICHKDRPCVNNGTCVDGKCFCTIDFSGDLCEFKIDPRTGKFVAKDVSSPVMEFCQWRGLLQECIMLNSLQAQYIR